MIFYIFYDFYAILFCKLLLQKKMPAERGILLCASSIKNHSVETDGSACSFTGIA